jgi:hypothetical protein
MSDLEEACSPSALDAPVALASGSHEAFVAALEFAHQPDLDRETQFAAMMEVYRTAAVCRGAR